MQIFITCFLFALGILFVVKGGDVFVDSATAIAKILKVPTFIIGATIVSLATTLPEMIVSCMAAAEGSNEMAIGNAVGSVTANTAIIMATAMIAMTIFAPRKKYMKQILLLISATVVLWIASLKGYLNIWGSIILVIIFALFMIQNVLSAKNEISALNIKDAEKELQEKNKEKNEADTNGKNNIGKNILFFVLGAAAIVVGSRLMVDNGTNIARWLKVDERIIAVTLVAIGTSLPELVTTITAIVKKESSLSAGNIIGANIIDISLILPLCSVISNKPIPVSHNSLFIDFPVCILVTLVAMIPILFRQKSSKFQGILLVAIYAVYLAVTIF